METLKSFENILLGQKVIVYTDHLNLLYQKLASNRMIRWQMMLEEFGPKFKHIQGKRNVVADALSRLPLEYKEEDLQETERELPELSYVNQKDIQEETFPMLPSLIAKEQIKDKQLQQTVKNNDKREYYTKKIEGVRLIHYRKKIYIPSKLQARIIAWYHTYLVHLGTTRMEQTLRSVFLLAQVKLVLPVKRLRKVGRNMDNYLQNKQKPNPGLE